LEEGTLFVRQGKIYREEQGTGRVEVTADDLPTGDNKDRVFIELIRGTQTENPIDSANGLRVIQLTEAAWKSANLNRPVQVDLG